MHQIVHAFYKFVNLPDYKSLRAPLQKCCGDAGLVGSILLAREGLNGTVAGSEEGLAALWSCLHADARLADMEAKGSASHCETFYRMKVRLKQEIVSMGIPSVDPTRHVGTYIKPQDWNALIASPDVCLIDARNHYEVDVGSFKGAITPGIDSFRDFPAYVDEHLDPEAHPKVAMFCTGGIRCEKATAYLLQKGFKQVFHLQGGILKYLETVPPEASTWEGDCFVFDNRVSVDHTLEHGNYAMCHMCRHALSAEEVRSSDYEKGISCPYCIGCTDETKRARASEREHQMRLAEQRHERHLGKVMTTSRKAASK
ncbi:MAG: rhodanese-related sulfurtransferase [Verrucomicrobia bacterium]|nr:rhodanese-related sulfurtransferase [Verrucomicrobiota bacterium]